jgi:arylsulfatase A-like enzyme
VRWRNCLPAGEVSDSLISLVDLAPTLLDVCGLDPLPNMQGMSQFATFKEPQKATREWCLIENRAEPSFYVKTLVMGRYKLNYYLHRGEGELYDLEQDPNEFTNLYHHAEYMEIKNQMFMKLVDIYGDLENPLPPRQSFA